MLNLAPQNTPKHTVWRSKNSKFSGEGALPPPKPFPSREGEHPLCVPHPIGAFGASILQPSWSVGLTLLSILLTLLSRPWRPLLACFARHTLSVLRTSAARHAQQCSVDHSPLLKIKMIKHGLLNYLPNYHSWSLAHQCVFIDKLPNVTNAHHPLLVGMGVPHINNFNIGLYIGSNCVLA